MLAPVRKKSAMGKLEDLDKLFAGDLSTARVIMLKENQKNP